MAAKVSGIVVDRIHTLTGISRPIIIAVLEAKNLAHLEVMVRHKSSLIDNDSTVHTGLIDGITGIYMRKRRNGIYSPFPYVVRDIRLGFQDGNDMRDSELLDYLVDIYDRRDDGKISEDPDPGL